MGEFAVTRAATDVLTTIGLGSCVGLVLLDGRRRVAGLAHVVFPQAPVAEPVTEPARYADTAVAALLAALARVGGAREAFEAVLVGGARMFSFGRTNEIDVGARNVSAVTSALAQAGVPVRAAATGGTLGRSIRVRAADGVVALRTAGIDSQLYKAFSGSQGGGAK